MSRLGETLRRRRLLIGSSACVVVACVIIVGVFEAERDFRLDVQGLVATQVGAEAPFASFAELQDWVRAQGYDVTVRARPPLEVVTNWRGEKRLRDRLAELRVGR